MMAHYNNSFSATVKSLFPEIGVDVLQFSRKLPSKYSLVPSLTIFSFLFVCFTDSLLAGYWNDSDNQRSFFLSFAKTKGFDPLIPSNWYTINAEEILQLKVIFLFSLISIISLHFEFDDFEFCFFSSLR